MFHIYIYPCPPSPQSQNEIPGMGSSVSFLREGIICSFVIFVLFHTAWLKEIMSIFQNNDGMKTLL